MTASPNPASKPSEAIMSQNFNFIATLLTEPNKA
jgi:hypothetical protein